MDRMTLDQALFQRDGYQQAYEHCRAEHRNALDLISALERNLNSAGAELDAARGRVAELEAENGQLRAGVTQARRLLAAKADR
jgi:regulator of replication initiation timing